MAKKQVTPIETITSLFMEAEEAMATAQDEWERFTEDNIKKGFKESRKAILQVKKFAAEIRKQMGLVMPKKEKKAKPEAKTRKKKTTKK